ncbi:hypothetical protein [Streptosporangium sp. NBC_01756]|uniref:hypothetical protein n=1 Tax=Streptosporangium sp. NBC_01756 TaxID=2975950 RepID=UPI002DDA7095|nr:hypothetical protein [Streptosporangium sp. NBC_01756]WSC87545.1 hypothetical protein OIE48_04860 [Streptosporangium sp. NBC_01756]
MLQRTRAIVVAVAMGAGALALAPSATAATGTSADPVISNVEINPSPVVVTGSPVNAKFSFTTKAAGKAELQVKAPGVSAWTSLDLKPSPHGVETRWTASKSFDAKSTTGQWSFLAIAHSGDGKEDSTRGKFGVELRKALDTKIVDFDASPDDVTRGHTLKVSGRLLRDAGSWRDYYGQSVTITFRERGTDAYRHVAKVRTGRGGWFATGVKAEATGWWRAEFDGHGGAKGSVSDTDQVTVRDPEPEPERADSRVIKFNASPEPVRYGRYLKFTGKLQVDDSGWEGHRAKVALYFKAKGSHKWGYVKTTWSNGSGNLYTKAKGYRSGYWKFVFRGDGDYYGDSSGSDYVRVYRR